MTTDLYPTIAARIGDPGAYVERKLTPGGEPMETVPRWAARAVVAAVQPVIDELTAERDQLAAYNRAVKGANGDLRAELAQVRAQLTAANRRADGLQNDLNSATKANTAWANETAAKDAVIDAAKTWRDVSRRLHDSPSAATVLDLSKALDGIAAAVDALPKPSAVAR